MIVLRIIRKLLKLLALLPITNSTTGIMVIMAMITVTVHTPIDAFFPLHFLHLEPGQTDEIMNFHSPFNFKINPPESPAPISSPISPEPSSPSISPEPSSPSNTNHIDEVIENANGRSSLTVFIDRLYGVAKSEWYNFRDLYNLNPFMDLNEFPSSAQTSIVYGTFNP